MLIKIIKLFALIGVGIILLFIDLKYPDINLQKGYITLFAIAGSYLLLKLFLDKLIIRKIKGSKTRYSLRKVTSVFFFIFLLVLILHIWIPNAQALLVSYGLIAAGVAIALQDFFKNIVGGIIVFVGGVYRIGDRIEVNGKFGDVIDIGIFYTSLLEMREWVKGDQTTGRIVTIPNEYVLSNNICNYTKDHGFIWDEIMLPITYKSNWKKAIKLIKEIVTKETMELTKEAEKEILVLKNKYYISKRNVEPDVFLLPTDNWIAFHVRYITEVGERRILHNKLVKLILEKIQKEPDITIASSTVAIVEFPKITTDGKQ